MLKLQSPSPTHEELFMQRYQRLLGWALQVTDHDRARAEDLVHDIFIQFTLSHPETDRLYNIDGYLYTMLRNMHLSQIRRATRLRDAAPSLADFDSAELGIRTVDPRNQIQVREELRLICQYACIRRNTSKAGCVLILRFFHGYYPSEIARILRSNCAAVDQWLRIARREVRMYLDDRDSLTFINATTDTTVAYPGGTSSTEDALAQLRKAIFAMNGTTCLSKEALRQQFSLETEGTLDNKTLSHVITCAACLDEVNRLLGLPPISERHPTDRIGPDRDVGGGDGPRGPGASSATAFTRRSRRQFKDVIEHRPQELRIAVNGFVLGSQRVSSEVSELSLSINQTEKLGFIEVFSDQEVRLLFLSIEPPPDGQAEYKEQVELSDGRSIELALRFSETWPNVDVVYRDPALAVAPILDSEFRAADEETVAGVQGSSPSVGEVVDGNTSQILTGRRLKLAWSTLRRHLPNLKPGTWNLELFSRPATVTAMVALILLASFALFYWRTPAPKLTAADLLNRSIAAEQSIAANTDQVLHRTLQLEERKYPNGDLIARSRIEIWQGKGLAALRHYDDRNKLVAGEWTKSDGSQVLYNHTSKLTFRSANDLPHQHGLTADDIWKIIPSAKEFSSLINTAGAQVEERGNAYVLSGSVTNSAPSAVSKAVLLMNKADLHAIEMTVVVEVQGTVVRGQGSGQATQLPDSRPQTPNLIEYHFVETAYERRAPQTVAPAIFEPDPELLSSAAPNTRPPTPETLSTAVTPLPAAATASLEVEVLRLLGQISADMGQEVSVKREADGALHVEAIVETEKRKAEILSVLSSVTHDRTLKVRIETNAEAQARIQRERRRTQTGSGSTDVDLQGVTTANLIPVDAEVRRYLRARGVSEQQVDGEISRLSNRMLNRSHQALLHAFAMKNLVQRFSADDLRSLDAQARSKWRAMIATHAQAFQRDLLSIRQELTPILGLGTGSGGADIEVTDEPSLFRAVTRLTELASTTNESIQSAFTISSANKSVALRTPQFWRSLRESDSLAGKIARSQ